MFFLVQGHCCHKRRLACRAPTPFATKALAIPVDIIELNDAADGPLVIQAVAFLELDFAFVRLDNCTQDQYGL